MWPQSVCVPCALCMPKVPDAFLLGLINMLVNG